MNTTVMILVYIAIFAGMYFFLIRPQNKKKKEEQKMRENTQIGDEIVTIGGFYGRIVAIKDDSYVIESTVDRSKMRILKNAVQTVLTVHEVEAPQKETAKKEKAKKSK